MALIMGKQSKQSIIEQVMWPLRNGFDEGDGSKGAEHVRIKHDPQQQIAPLELPRVYCLNQSEGRSSRLVNLDETGEICRRGMVKTFVYNGENLENNALMDWEPSKWCDVVVFTTLFISFAARFWTPWRPLVSDDEIPCSNELKKLSLDVTTARTALFACWVVGKWPYASYIASDKEKTRDGSSSEQSQTPPQSSKQ